MAKKDKGKDRERVWSLWYRRTRVDLPRPKGKFRNMFPEMVPKPKRTCDCAQSERGAAESEQSGV